MTESSLCVCFHLNGIEISSTLPDEIDALLAVDIYCATSLAVTCCTSTETTAIGV